MEIISLVLYESLTNCGIECVLSRDVGNNMDKLWIFTISRFDLIPVPQRYIFYQTEPKTMIGTKLRDFISNAIQVWEYCDNNLEFVTTINKNTIYMPFRYTECLETWNKINSFEKKTDILFIGHITEYRKSILNELKNHFDIKIIPDMVFGQEREIEIKQSKIILVLNRFEDYSLYPQDISRVFIHGSKKDFFICYKYINTISEHINCSNTIEQLIENIHFFIKNDDKRQENTDFIYSDIIKMKMTEIIDKNMEKLIIC